MSASPAHRLPEVGQALRPWAQGKSPRTLPVTSAVDRTPWAGRENQVPSAILTTVGGQASLAFVPNPLLPPSRVTAVASDRGFSGTGHVSNICYGQKCQPAGGPERLVSLGQGPFLWPSHGNWPSSGCRESKGLSHCPFGIFAKYKYIRLYRIEE